MTETDKDYLYMALEHIMRALDAIERNTTIEQTREEPEEDPDKEEVYAVQSAKEVAVRHKQFQLASELRLFERALACDFPIPEGEQPERKVPQPLTKREVIELDMPETSSRVAILKLRGFGIYRIADVEAGCK